MIRLLLLLITASAIANPFHKYPYVFLLDVGNEELEKVNTEQIRVSKQGGSLALRYPAIGNGEDIAHVRVSGIDFGTDLKADIVDGGPGYKYVVIVLIGNQGVNFDAVITIQTVPANVDANLQSTKISDYQSPEKNEVNDSAEDSSDDNEEKGDSAEASQITVKEAELTQESSNIYNYAVNEALNGYGDSIHSSQSDTGEEKNDDNDADEETNNEYVKYSENIDKSDAQFDEENDGYSLSLKQHAQEQIKNDEDNSGIDQSYAFDDRIQQLFVPNDVYRAEPYSVGRGEDFSQVAVPGSDTVYVEEPDGEGLNLAQILDDEYEEDDDYSRNGDKNSNFIDRSEKSAVAY